MLCPGTAAKGYRRWTPGAVNIDVRAQGNHVNYRAHVNWPQTLAHVERHTPWHFFYRLFPIAFIATIIEHTNNEIQRKGIRCRPIEQHELVTYLGIRVAIGLERPRGSIQEIFSSFEAEGTIFRASNYAERFGMSHKRFCEISSNFRLASYLPPSENRDPWHEIRAFIDAFNNNMAANYTPGLYLLVDEIMSAWKGLSAFFDALGLPHQTKIIRKPEGVGAELKAVACGQSRVILRVELMEGKIAQRAKPFSVYGEGTAVLLRLCQPWSGTGRCVVSDSAFASVKQTILTKAILGLYSAGMVKTAHSHYPKDYFRVWFATEDAAHKANPQAVPRGRWRTLISSFRNPVNLNDQTLYPIYAIGWADKKLKTIVSNFGTDLQSLTDSVRRRTKKIVDPGSGEFITINYTKNVIRPVMIEQFFSAFPAIDVNDHLRQGILELERQWLTQSWWVRIFTTMLGVSIVGSFLASSSEYVDNAQLFGQINMPDFLDFAGQLAHAMIFNPMRVDYLANARGQRVAGQQEARANFVEVRFHSSFTRLFKRLLLLFVDSSYLIQYLPPTC